MLSIVMQEEVLNPSFIISEAIVWQAGDILLNEWEESLLIVVAHEVEGEVLGIAVILLGKRHQAIVVDGVDLSRSRNAANLATQVKGALQ